MRHVLKHSFNPVDGYAHIILPEGKIVHVGEQNKKVCIWYESRCDAIECLRHKFCFLPTGSGLRDPLMQHVQSVQMQDGLVWHVYMKVED